MEIQEKQKLGLRFRNLGENQMNGKIGHPIETGVMQWFIGFCLEVLRLLSNKCYWAYDRTIGDTR